MNGIRLRRRNLGLGTIGLLLGLMVALGLRSAGLAWFESSSWAAVLLLVVVLQGALFLLVALGWDRRIPFDPHFTYLPMTVGITLFCAIIAAVPAGRHLALVGWFAVVVVMANRARAGRIFLAGGVVALGYGAVLAYWLRRGLEIDLRYEAVYVAVFLLVHALTEMVLVGIRRTRNESERRYLALAEASPVGILRTTPLGSCLYANERWTEISGLSEEESTGDAWLGAIHPEERQQISDDWFHATRHALPFRREFRIERADGRTTWVSAQAVPEVTPGGKVTAYVGTVTDITDRVRAQEAAEQANRAKGDFLANMSHEIRTPINGIMGMTRQLLKAGLPDPQRHFAEVVHSSAEGLLTLIDDILDFSKIEAGKLTVDRVPFTLSDVIRGVLDLMAPRAEAKDIELRTDFSARVPETLVGDPARLRQVLLNLVGNAIKFTEDGRVTLEVELEERDEESVRLHFAVHDTGIGISPQAQETLFSPFRQADTSTTRRYGGTGLGLAISKRVVSLMGGAIGVQSTPGVGTTFWFSLPFGAVEETATISLSPRRFAGSGRANRQRRTSHRILVAEDDPVNRELLLIELEALGFDADAVSTGREALAAIERRDYDLVLMDCQMPELDGYEATRRIRHREAGGHQVPIIAVTAHTLAGDREKCLAAGMDDFLPKPYREENLVAVIEKWLGATPAAERSAAIAETNGSQTPAAAGNGGDETAGVVDPEVIERLRQLGDQVGEPLLLQLSETFIRAGSDRLEILRQALSTKDVRLFERTAHSFKGSAAQLGARRLSALCADLEVLARGPGLVDCGPRLPAVEAAFEEASARLKALSDESSVG